MTEDSWRPRGGSDEQLETRTVTTQIARRVVRMADHECSGRARAIVSRSLSGLRRLADRSRHRLRRRRRYGSFASTSTQSSHGASLPSVLNVAWTCANWAAGVPGAMPDVARSTHASLVHGWSQVRIASPTAVSAADGLGTKLDHITLSITCGRPKSWTGESHVDSRRVVSGP